MVEHVLCKHEVTGSIPVASTNYAAGVVTHRSFCVSRAKAGGGRAGEARAVSGV